MGSKEAVQSGFKLVKPLMSSNDHDCKRRALNLYKAWYRSIPEIVHHVGLLKNTKQCHEKLREEFYKNKNVTDLRVRDALILKGQMELQETASHFQQKSHIMVRWKDTQPEKAKDFLSKFFSNQK